MEDDVDVWRYAILELHARNDNDDDLIRVQAIIEIKYVDMKLE